MIGRMFRIPYLVLVLIAGSLTACAVPRPFTPRIPEPSQPPPQPAPQVQTKPAPLPEPAAPSPPMPTPAPTPSPAVRPHTLSAASKALVTQAQAQATAGNDALASQTIERALRIESDNPLLWIELAKIRQNSGNASQAENMARKALTMASGDSKAQAAAWRVIAESYRTRGRNPEARDADAKAASLMGG
jgi:Flp pilus assembly protein TadD